MYLELKEYLDAELKLASGATGQLFDNMTIRAGDAGMVTDFFALILGIFISS